MDAHAVRCRSHAHHGRSEGTSAGEGTHAAPSAERTIGGSRASDAECIPACTAVAACSKNAGTSRGTVECPATELGSGSGARSASVLIPSLPGARWRSGFAHDRSAGARRGADRRTVIGVGTTGQRAARKRGIQRQAHASLKYKVSHRATFRRAQCERRVDGPGVCKIDTALGGNFSGCPNGLRRSRRWRSSPSRDRNRRSC